MKHIACLGSEQFTLGFQLAGIRYVHEPGSDLLDTIHTIRKDTDIGIVIVEESLLANLESQDRTDIEDSVNPVFIPLSTQVEADAIRKLIIKSIGVDVWKEN